MVTVRNAYTAFQDEAMDMFRRRRVQNNDRMELTVFALARNFASL